jgi:serine/threonine protein kinase
MSATTLDPAMTTNKRSPATTDLESTTDLTGEHTTDLSPVTSEIEQRAQIVGTPELERVDPAHPAHGDGAEPVNGKTRAPEPAATFTTREIPGLGSERPAAQQPLAPGAILCDRFILERVVGSGGTAVVFQARDMSHARDQDTSANVRVAVKTPRLDRGDRERAAARLHHEFEQARKLSHPNIVRVFDLYEHGETRFMTMELIEGRLLSTLVRDWTMLPRALANKILRSCALALDHAHEHDVVHGDFKPGNVFLTREEDIKIVDFGAAAALSGGSTRIPAGTPAYASPQVLSGETPDRRDDIFSFACVAYELLTGQHPFQHRSSLEARDSGLTPTRAWNLSAPQWLALLSALAWDREQRPQDILALLDSLLTESEPIAIAPPIQPTDKVVATELQPELMPAQRGWGFFVFVACAAVVIFIAAQRQDGPGDPTIVATTDEPPTVPASLPALQNSVVGALERREPLPAMTEDTSFDSDAAAPGPTSTAMLSPAAAARPAVEIPPKRSVPPAALSEITFDSPTIVTTESSVAAVFLIKRSQPLRGRVRVQWVATSGTADAGIDFASNASGWVEFADGQAQRAIYVPLRNDLIKEEDETFKVQLQSPQNARLGATAAAEAIIRDDE